MQKSSTLPKKVVFTRTLSDTAWENTVLASGDLKEEVRSLKEAAGQDLIAYGGAEFVSSLIAAGLVDEFHLFVNPVAIGRGLPVFQNGEALSLVNAKSFDCGIVALQYVPRPA